MISDADKKGLEDAEEAAFQRVFSRACLDTANRKIRELDAEIARLRAQMQELGVSENMLSLLFGYRQAVREFESRLVELTADRKFLTELADALYPKGFQVQIAAAAQATSLEDVAYSGIGGQAKGADISSAVFRLLDALRKYASQKNTKPLLKA